MPDTDWFAKCGWGVFCHYLGAPKETAEEWNADVDSFQVDALAEQLEQIQARYFFLTLGQNSGHYCAPNETYDRIVGIEPSKCSRRDLVSDLYEALQPRGIELLVYAPADGPVYSSSLREREAFGITKNWSDGDSDLDWVTMTGPTWAKYRLPEAQQLWQDVCRDWSLRFGKKVRGWWIDGAYGGEERYPKNEPPNFETFSDALRAGNPDSILAFNPGVFTPVICCTSHEDYTTGEQFRNLPECPGRWVELDGHKAQYHVLAFQGENWSGRTPRFPDELAVGYTKHVISNGGVMTWEVAIDASGTIPDASFRQLSVIGNSVCINRRLSVDGVLFGKANRKL